MCKTKFLILICSILALYSCQKKSPTETPADNNIFPQVEIPWPSLADSPWPMHHHDPQSTGRSKYPGPRKGKIKWTFKPDGHIHESIAIGPDSTIYFVSMYEPENGKQKSSLYAVRPDGILKWRFFFDISSMDANPFLTADGTIYLYVPERDPAIYAISPDGQLINKLSPGLERLRYLSVGLDGFFYFTAGDGHFYVMSQQGEILLSSYIENGYVSRFPSISPDGQTIYVFQHEEPYHVSNLCAIDRIGNLKWRFSFNDTLCSSSVRPLIDNSGNIYLGVHCNENKDYFYSISSDGKMNWKYMAISCHGEDAIIGPNGNIYFQSGAVDAKLISLDAKGNLRWERAIQESKTSLVIDRDGIIYLFQPDATAYTPEGEKLWQIPLEGYISRITSPAIGYGGILYVGTYGTNSKLYVIE